jgi:DNA-binding response OmpR family regulator
MVQEQGLSLVQAHFKLIFIVEDDTIMEEFLVTAITDETPYQVIAFHNGFEALEAVKDIKPQLFILDYLLPGMNGLELYDKLHAIEEMADTPTIMYSTNTPTKELQKRKIIGIPKPFGLDEFLDTIEMLLA